MATRTPPAPPVLDPRPVLARTSSPRSVWRSRAARALVLAASAALAEVVAGSGWAWPLVVAALWLSVRSLRPVHGPALERMLGWTWCWIALILLAAWVTPILGTRPGPAFLTVTAGLAFVWWPWPRDRRRPSAAGVRAAVAATIPVVVLAGPLLLARDLASLVSALGSGWDTANHVLMVRAAAVAGGVPLLGADPPALLPTALLDYPSGAHQAWAAWGSLAGLPGDGSADVVRWYPVAAALTLLLLSLTAVAAYRRLAPWAGRRPWADTVGLATVVAALAVGPMPGLWSAGFHNYTLAVASALGSAALCATRRPVSAPVVWTSGALLVVTATTYPVVAPVAGVAFLVVAVRGWRAGRRRAVALTAVVVAAGLFPPVLPYTSSLGAAGGLGSADLLSLPGGLVQVSYAVVAALVLLAAAALRTDGTRRRMAAAWGPAVTAAVVTAVVTGLNLRAVGQIGYYADKSMYVVCALLVPAAAAGAALLVTWPPRVRVVAVGLAGLALVGVVAAVDPRVPRDPMGTVQAAPGVEFLRTVRGERALSWVDGRRVAAATRDGAGWNGRAVLPLGSVVGPERLVPGNREIEGYWIDVLAPSHAASARLMSYLARDAATLPQVMCSLAVFASHHDGLAVVAVADTPGQAAAARDALDGCRQGRATAVAVETLDLPAAPWYLRGEPDPGVR